MLPLGSVYEVANRTFALANGDSPPAGSTSEPWDERELCQSAGCTSSVCAGGGSPGVESLEGEFKENMVVSVEFYANGPVMFSLYPYDEKLLS